MRVKVLFFVIAAAFCLAASTPAAQTVPLVGEPMALPAVPVAAAPAEIPQSSILVKQLVTAMSALKLDAIAAKDPAEPGRFVAALVFPGVQVLVISSRHQALDYVTMQLGKREFRSVYEELQRGVPEGRLFFHDMGCDGFVRNDSIDIFYEGPTAQTLLDGDWAAQSLTEAAYQAKRKA
ncbi:MAG: hypothetical protein WD227_10890, partial [Vicinamibacterales bacterium]